jgi:type IV pilus assembly protein PilE
MHTLTHKRGFSLVELMVVVAIVGIIAAVAIPSYNRYAQSAKKRAAQAYLVELAQAQSQSLADSRTYKSTVAELNSTPPANVSDYYTISIALVAGPPPRFTLSATPLAGKAMDGTATLTLDSAGTKAPAADW